MSLQGRIEELSVRHRKLDEKIETEQKRPVYDITQLKELKRLQKENERLRKAVSDLTLDKLILKEAARGNF